ncbi:MAG TPA: hypothetical protein VD790_10245 [Thermoleophilaceae bacterium]|nr:hypothetical protein [Thermoleophilaceae bacterium]
MEASSPGSGGKFVIETPVAMPSEESREHVTVRRRDLDEWAAEVERIIKNPLENASAWTAGLATLAIGVAISGLTLLAAEDVPMWVHLVHWSVVAGAGFSAVFTGWVNSQQQKSTQGRGDLLAGRIRKECEHAPTAGQD